MSTWYADFKLSPYMVWVFMVFVIWWINLQQGLTIEKNDGIIYIIYYKIRFKDFGLCISIFLRDSLM